MVEIEFVSERRHHFRKEPGAYEIQPADDDNDDDDDEDMDDDDIIGDSVDFKSHINSRKPRGNQVPIASLPVKAPQEPHPPPLSKPDPDPFLASAVPSSVSNVNSHVPKHTNGVPPNASGGPGKTIIMGGPAGNVPGSANNNNNNSANNNNTGNTNAKSKTTSPRDPQEEITKDDLQAMKDMIGDIKKDPSLLYRLSSLPGNAAPAPVPVPIPAPVPVDRPFLNPMMMTRGVGGSIGGFVDDDTEVSSLGMLSSGDYTNQQQYQQQQQSFTHAAPGDRHTSNPMSTHFGSGINVPITSSSPNKTYHNPSKPMSNITAARRTTHDAEIALRMQSLRAKRGLTTSFTTASMASRTMATTSTKHNTYTPPLKSAPTMPPATMTPASAPVSSLGVSPAIGSGRASLPGNLSGMESSVHLGGTTTIVESTLEIARLGGSSSTNSASAALSAGTISNTTGGTSGAGAINEPSSVPISKAEQYKLRLATTSPENDTEASASTKQKSNNISERGNGGVIGDHYGHGASDKTFDASLHSFGNESEGDQSSVALVLYRGEKSDTDSSSVQDSNYGVHSINTNGDAETKSGIESNDRDNASLPSSAVAEDNSVIAAARAEAAMQAIVKEESKSSKYNSTVGASKYADENGGHLSSRGGNTGGGGLREKRHSAKNSSRRTKEDSRSIERRRSKSERSYSRSEKSEVSPHRSHRHSTHRCRSNDSEKYSSLANRQRSSSARHLPVRPAERSKSQAPPSTSSFRPRHKDRSGSRGPNPGSRLRAKSESAAKNLRIIRDRVTLVDNPRQGKELSGLRPREEEIYQSLSASERKYLLDKLGGKEKRKKESKSKRFREGSLRSSRSLINIDGERLDTRHGSVEKEKDGRLGSVDLPARHPELVAKHLEIKEMHKNDGVGPSSAHQFEGDHEDMDLSQFSRLDIPRRLSDGVSCQDGESHSGRSVISRLSQLQRRVTSLTPAKKSGDHSTPHQTIFVQPEVGQNLYAYPTEHDSPKRSTGSDSSGQGHQRKPSRGRLISRLSHFGSMTSPAVRQRSVDIVDDHNALSVTGSSEFDGKFGAIIGDFSDRSLLGNDETDLLAASKELMLYSGSVARLCDDKGRCIFHPHIRLQKPKLFGGWKIIFKHCPDCAVEHMKRSQQELARQALKRKKKRKARKNELAQSISSISHRGEIHDGKESERHLPIAREPVASQIAGEGKDPTHKELTEVNSIIDNDSLSHYHYGQNSAEYSSFVKKESEAEESERKPDYQTKSQPELPASQSVADSSKPKSKNVNGLPWSDYNGQSGRYTGEVNEQYLPHGKGEMVYDRGVISAGIWYNGVLDTEGPVTQETIVADRLSNYSVGDQGRDEDMMIDTKKATVEAVAEIRVNDGAFVRRSDGSWTYAIVKDRTDGDNPTIRFKVNSRGSTKAFPMSQWGTYIRRVKRSDAPDRRPTLDDLLQQRRKANMGSSHSVSGTPHCDPGDDHSVSSVRSAPMMSSGSSSISGSSSVSSSKSNTMENLTKGKMTVRSRSRSRSRNRKNVTTLPLLFSSSMSVSEETEGNYDDGWETASGSGYRLRGIDP